MERKSQQNIYKSLWCIDSSQTSQGCLIVLLEKVCFLLLESQKTSTSFLSWSGLYVLSCKDVSVVKNDSSHCYNKACDAELTCLIYIGSRLSSSLLTKKEVPWGLQGLAPTGEAWAETVSKAHCRRLQVTSRASTSLELLGRYKRDAAEQIQIVLLTLLQKGLTPEILAHGQMGAAAVQSGTKGCA